MKRVKVQKDYSKVPMEKCPLCGARLWLKWGGRKLICTNYVKAENHIIVGDKTCSFIVDCVDNMNTHEIPSLILFLIALCGGMLCLFMTFDGILRLFGVVSLNYPEAEGPLWAWSLGLVLSIAPFVIYVIKKESVGFVDAKLYDL